MRYIVGRAGLVFSDVLSGLFGRFDASIASRKEARAPATAMPAKIACQMVVSLCVPK
jgi:hypothetical protein